MENEISTESRSPPDTLTGRTVKRPDPIQNFEKEKTKMVVIIMNEEHPDGYLADLIEKTPNDFQIPEMDELDFRPYL